MRHFGVDTSCLFLHYAHKRYSRLNTKNNRLKRYIIYLPSLTSQVEKSGTLLLVEGDRIEITSHNLKSVPLHLKTDERWGNTKL